MTTPNKRLMQQYSTEDVFFAKQAGAPPLLSLLGASMLEYAIANQKNKDIALRRLPDALRYAELRARRLARMELAAQPLRHTRAPLLVRAMAPTEGRLPEEEGIIPVPAGWDEGMVRLASVATEVGAGLAKNTVGQRAARMAGHILSSNPVAMSHAVDPIEKKMFDKETLQQMMAGRAARNTRPPAMPVSAASRAAAQERPTLPAIPRAIEALPQERLTLPAVPNAMRPPPQTPTPTPAQAQASGLSAAEAAKARSRARIAANTMPWSRPKAAVTGAAPSGEDWQRFALGPVGVAGNVLLGGAALGTLALGGATIQGYRRAMSQEPIGPMVYGRPSQQGMGFNLPYGVNQYGYAEASAPYSYASPL